MFVCDLKQKTPTIYLIIKSGMVWEEKLCCEEFDLHADICNLGSAFLATDYMSFLLKPGTRAQNMRPNRLIYIHKSLA